MDIKEIIRLAFLKYRLSGRRSMNTFIFTQAKNNKLSDEEIENLLDTLENKIAEYQEKNKQKEEWQNLDFTCNLKKSKKINKIIV